MKDIFISYAREDSGIAKKLFHTLEEEGFSVWWDREIPPGKTFDEVIKEHLEASRCVIVLWSMNSVSSNWVMDEAAEAHSRNKLIPVMAGKVDIPFGFRRLQAADLINWKGSRTDHEFEKLVESVHLFIPSKKPVDKEISTEAKSEIIDIKGAGKLIKASWTTKFSLTVLLCFYYIGIVSQASASDDIVAFSALIGFPISIYLIFTKFPYRISWIILPIISYFIGMPYGHNYGTMTKSPVFGLSQGTECQSEPMTTILLFIILIIAVIDHKLLLNIKKKHQSGSN